LFSEAWQTCLPKRMKIKNAAAAGGGARWVMAQKVVHEHAQRANNAGRPTAKEKLKSTYV